MVRELSDRQRRIYEFLYDYMRAKERPPTVREIGEAVGIPSTSVVKYNLAKLAEEGLIEYNPKIARGIRLLGETVRRLADSIRIPILGPIAAGQPIPVPDTSLDYERTIELTRDIVKNQKGIYALEVQGDSMIDALIHDGDIVLMRYQPTVENGELAAVWLRREEEATLKRFYLEGDRVRLQPANPMMKPIFVPADNVEVKGKVVCVIRRLDH